MLNYTNEGQNSRLRTMYMRSVLEYGTPRKIINALRTELAYRLRSPIVRSRPYILFLEPLYFCNLDCPLCDRNVFPQDRRGNAGKLAMDLYRRVLDEIGDDLFQVQIFGQGEPLMNWQLAREVIEETHKRRIFTMLSTNATLLTEEIAEGLVRTGLDHLVCAIDGVTQAAYEIYRIGGQVEAALAGLRHVVAARDRAGTRAAKRMAIEWQYLTHSRNLHEVELARGMAKELGVSFRTAPIRGMEWDTTLENEWMTEGGRRLRPGEYDRDFPCYFLWRSLVLNSNGKVARCLIYQNVSEYVDLHHNSVMDAYNHPSVQAARRLFRRGGAAPSDAPSICEGCGYFAREHGPAPAGRKARVGNIQEGGLIQDADLR